MKIYLQKITLQPLKRFDLDAANYFLRYFNVTLWVGTESRIYKKTLALN